MDKLEAQPFFDANGNLVIPPKLLGKKRDEKELVLRTATDVIRFILKGGHVRLLRNDRKLVSFLDVGEKEPVPVEAGTPGDDMLKLAQSSMSFWDNPVDDAVWNDA